MIRAALLLLLCSALPVFAATEVITLNHRMATEVLDVAESVVGDTGRISTHSNRLIVNAPPAVIDELREVLNQLDRPPRRLLISVDTQDSAVAQGNGYSVDGSARIGDVEIVSGRGEIHGRDQVRIIRNQTNSRDGGVQQVQTTEGYPALISAGQSVPFTTTEFDAYGRPYRSTQYRQLDRGFYATAEVIGDRVQVRLSSQRQQLNQHSRNVVDVQSAETRVTGRLGEWISVGGIDESASSTQSGTLRRYATEGQQNYQLRLKVEVLE